MFEDSKAFSIRQNKIFYFSRRGKIITENTENDKTSNASFSITVKNLKIPRFCSTNPLVDHMTHPALKVN